MRRRLGAGRPASLPGRASGPATSVTKLVTKLGATSVATAVALATLALGAAPARAQEGLGIPSRPPEEPPAQVEAKKLTKLPKQTKFVEAEYPKEALEKGIEADVVLMLDINADGKIDSASVAEPANPPGLGFDEAALVAAQQFEFEPAEMDGKKIAVQITYKYKFKLAPKAPPPAPANPDGGAPDATPPAVPAAPSVPAAPAPAPVVNFSGVLRERGTRLPLGGILVTVFRDDEAGKPVGYEATSDATGAFRFFDLGPGDWKVLVEPPGFFPYRTTETTKVGERVDVVYYVERGAYNPYDVTVTATRPRKEVSRTVITAQELDKIPGTFGDPLAVIQNFAGVARPPPFSGLLIIRGSAPSDSRFFADGAEIPLIYHFGGLRTVLPVGIIDSLEFYPGNFSPMYGRATGGIIDLQIKKLHPKKWGGYADINLFDSGVYIEGPIGDGEKGGFAIAGRRSYIDYLLNAAVPSNAPINFITAPRYYDYQLLANYRPTPEHDFRGFLFGSDDELALLFKNPGALTAQLTNNSASLSTTFYRSILTYNFTPNDTIQNSFKVAQGRNKTDVSFGQLALDLNTYVSQIRDTVHWKQGDHFALTSGVDVLFSRTDVFVNAPLPPQEGEPPMRPDLTMTKTTNRQNVAEWSPAAIIEGVVKPVPRLLLLPGLRVDRFGAVNQTVAQPRITLRWGATDQITVKGGVGLFAEEPTPDQTDPSFGNPALKTERAIHYSAGVEFKPRPYITLDATGFYKDIYNLVSPTTATTRDPVTNMVRPLIYDNGGKGRVIGLELVARHDFTHNFSGWLAYTLSRATRRDSGATEDRLFDFDQTHILTIIGSYLLPRNWQVGGRFRLVSGNPITPVTGAVYNASFDRYDPTYGKVNSSRLPAFNQLDLRVDKRWIYQKWILNVYLDIQNVYNRANVEDLDFNYNFRQSNPQQGLPILPILGVRGEF